MANNAIGKLFNTTPVVVQSNAVTSIIDAAHDDSAKADFEMGRANVHELIHTGQDAMYNLLQVAVSSQQPAAYEALASMMNVMLKANKSLLDGQKQIREISNASKPQNENAPNITNNNLFVGSTAELQAAIEANKNKT